MEVHIIQSIGTKNYVIDEITYAVNDKMIRSKIGR